jgi:hypothetical protein
MYIYRLNYTHMHGYIQIQTCTSTEVSYFNDIVCYMFWLPLGYMVSLPFCGHFPEIWECVPWGDAAYSRHLQLGTSGGRGCHLRGMDSWEQE